MKLTVRLHALLIVLALLWSTPAVAQTPASNSSWWTTRYLVDYGLILGGAGTYLVASQFHPRTQALFGPQYDPSNPGAVFDQKYAARIGFPYASGHPAGETVPTGHVFVIAGVTAAYLAAQEGAYWAFSNDGSPQQFHDTMIGFTEAVALTVGVTEIAKRVAGRLRPDFQDRARRYLCTTGTPPASVGCTGNEKPLDPDPKKAKEIFTDGRMSFWSGHSSTSFAVLGFAALAVGGRWVWGDKATTTSRPIGILLQTAMLSTAGFVAGSRLDDHRHHVTDVLVGSLVGFGFANLAYWQHFGTDGLPVSHPASTASSTSTTQVALSAGPGPEVSFAWRF